MTLISRYKYVVEPDQPLEPDQIMAIEARVMLGREIERAMHDLENTLWQALQWTFAPSNRKAAEIISTQWHELMPQLLSDTDVVDIDLTAFADNPDEGDGGIHMGALLSLLLLLGDRAGAYWKETWQKGQPWIARFEARKKQEE